MSSSDTCLIFELAFYPANKQVFYISIGLRIGCEAKGELWGELFRRLHLDDCLFVICHMNFTARVI